MENVSFRGNSCINEVETQKHEEVDLSAMTVIQ